MTSKAFELAQLGDTVTVDGSGNVDVTGSILSDQIFFGSRTGTDRAYVGYTGNDAFLWNVDNGVMRFGTNDSERMRITSDGNLGFGANPSSAVGNGDNTTHIGSDGEIQIRRADGTGRSMMKFRNGANHVGSITTTSSATTFATSSDYRLKEDWQPVANASDRLMQLKPCNFAWKADGSRVDGFLAHEAQIIVPEAVTGTKDKVDADGNPVMQGIDQSKLVPLLTAALQEALTKIETLETKVAALEAG